ncbi:MAG: EutN/CcmL family microcompartment protein [Actinomycetia bacterium]|nr:EutN/CcmL family microcompartment protein [Actinomycetes bacterium]
MYLAKVRGTVVSTRKDDRLVGFKLLVIHRLDTAGGFIGMPAIAVDTVDAGVGETVIVTAGSSARYAASRHDAPIDATIVGIVDVVTVED